MKVQCYAIFDQCSGIYEKPFFSTADAVVVREFRDIVEMDDHPIANHPEHYSLWRLGNFDNTTGKMLNEDNECLIQGVEARALELNNPEGQIDFVDKYDEKPGGTN